MSEQIPSIGPILVTLTVFNTPVAFYSNDLRKTKKHDIKKHKKNIKKYFKNLTKNKIRKNKIHKNMFLYFYKIH